jgi:raffinose/stachyose/melibiose transport system substrate-binding protein
MKNLLKIKGFILIAFIIAGSLLFINADGEKKQVTLEFWTPDPYTVYPDFQRYISDAISEFEKQNPQIKIDHQVKGYYDDYKRTLKIAFSEDKLPDVFFCYLGEFVQPYIQQGKVLCLDNYLNSNSRKRILKGALPNISEDGKIYTLPFTGYCAFILCNTAIFEENALFYPNTFDELLQICKKLKEKGITPIAHSNYEEDKWPNIFLYETLVLRHGGYETIIEKGVKKSNFKDKAFLEAAQDIKALISAGAFPEDMNNLNYSDGINLFSYGKAAMCFSGNWVIGMIGQGNELITGNKIKVIRFPGVNNGKGDIKDTWGGAFSGFMVKADSKYKKEAARFVEFLSEYLASQNYLHNQEIPLWQVDGQPINRNVLIEQLNVLAQEATTLAPGWDLYLNEQNRDIYWIKLRALFASSFSPEEFYQSLPGNE